MYRIFYPIIYHDAYYCILITVGLTYIALVVNLWNNVHNAFQSGRKEETDRSAEVFLYKF